MCILSIVSMLYRETLAVAPTVRFTASVVMMWPICYSDTLFNFNFRDTADFLSNGRLREIKTAENFKQSSLKVLAYERWSPTRGSIYSDFT